MARLPRREDLGALPSARSGRPIATIDAKIAAAPSRAVARLGEQVAQLGSVLYKKANESEDLDYEQQFQEFKWAQAQRLDQAMREVEPGQASRFAETWGQSYDEDARAFFQTVPERLKPVYDRRLRETFFGLYGDADAFARKEQKRFAVNDLEDKVKTRYALYGDLDQAVRDYDDYLATIPDLTPIDKDEIRRKHLDEMEAVNAESRLNRGEIDDLINDLDQWPKETRPHQRAAIERHSDGMATVTTGSSARFRVAGKYADRFAGALAELEAAGIIADPDQSGGYNPRNIRGTNIPSRHAFGEAIDVNWRDNAQGTDGTIDPELARTIARRWGLKWGGDWEGSRRDPMHFEVDRSVGKPPALEEERPEPVRVAGSGAAGEPADEGKTEPAGARLPRYRHLSPQRRAALLYKARTARSAITQQELRDDAERIRKTGQPNIAPDGTTSLDRAARYLTRNQLDQHRLEWQEAELEHRAIAPLEHLTEDEAIEHLTNIVPEAEASGASYASAVKVEERANQAWRRIKEMRAKDPALAVANAPEVQEAESTIARLSSLPEAPPGTTLVGRALPPQEAMRMRIEARKAAQRRIGLREWEIKPITEAEAKDLLDMPEPASLDPGQFYDGLIAAANRAEATYGPAYAREVMTAAVSFMRRDKEEKEVSSGIIAKMALGEPVTARDVSMLEQVRDIDRIARVFEEPIAPGDDMQTLGPGFPAQSPDLTRPPLMDTYPAATKRLEYGPPAPPERKPSDAQINWLLQDPKTRASRFDRLFGPGAAAKVIEQMQKRGRKGGEGGGPFGPRRE